MIQSIRAVIQFNICCNLIFSCCSRGSNKAPNLIVRAQNGSIQHLEVLSNSVFGFSNRWPCLHFLAIRPFLTKKKQLNNLVIHIQWTFQNILKTELTPTWHSEIQLLYELSVLKCNACHATQEQNWKTMISHIFCFFVFFLCLDLIHFKNALHDCNDLNAHLCWPCF